METIKVKPWGKDQGDFVVINKDDFNADLHELFEVGAAVKKQTIDDLRKILQENGVEFASDAKKAELQAMVDAIDKE